MKKKAEKGGSTYPHSTLKIYMNLFTAVLSVLLALTLLLHEPLLLLGYIGFSLSLVVIVLRLKTRKSNPKRKIQSSSSKEDEDNNNKGKWLLLMFTLMIIVLASPFLLAAVLPPYIWLTAIVGVATGLSVAEIVFYILRRRGVT